MPYALTIATPATRNLVVEAMRGRADVLKRAATRASADVEVDRAAGRDVRSRAVKLVTMLSQASELEALAAELEATEELALVESAPSLRLVPIPDPGAGDASTDAANGPVDDPPPAPAEDDDGLSAEAHAAAALAGLRPTVIGEREDPELGTLSEDEPTPEDVVDVSGALTAAEPPAPVGAP